MLPEIICLWNCCKHCLISFCFRASEESQLLECIGPSCALCQSSQNCVRINETKFEVALTRKCKNVPFENCECPEICQVLPKNICKKFPVKKKDHVCEEKPVRQCRKVKETICDGFVPIQGPGNPIPVEQELFKVRIKIIKLLYGFSIEYKIVKCLD